MDSPKFSFFKSESKWLRSTSIAAYIIALAALLGLIYSGWVAYSVMYSTDLSGESYTEGVVKDSHIDSKLAQSNLEGVKVSVVDTTFVTFTNSKGVYYFNGTPVGSVTLLFEYPGYQPVKLNDLFEESTKDARYEIPRISMKSFQKNSIPSILRPANLQGTIFSMISNSTVAEAVASIQGSSEYYDAAGLQKIAALNMSVETGSQGTFQFTNLPIGILELHVKVYFNETYWRSNHKVKIYEEVTTFVPSEGNTTFLNITFDDSAWSGLTEDLKDPFTIVNRKDTREIMDLKLFMDPDERSKGTLFIIAIYNQGTGVLVHTERNISANCSIELEQGIYKVESYNQVCKITSVNNVSISENRTMSIQMLFGGEPVVVDNADYFGYYRCALINVLLIIVGLVGAYFTFTRKKYLVAMVGSMACVLTQSPFVIPFVCMNLNINMLLGIVAFLFIFKSRDKFLDAPPALPAQDDKNAPSATPVAKDIPAKKDTHAKKDKPAPKVKKETVEKGEAVNMGMPITSKKKTGSIKMKAKKN